MCVYEIKDFEASLSSDPVITEISASSIEDAMYKYLPWPSVDIDIKAIKGIEGLKRVRDRNTDFRYEVKKLN
jgi:hypothetical protein